MAATTRADATVAAAATPAALETLRTRGDVAGQRAHGWQSFATIAAAFVPDGSVLRGWRDQAALFPAASATADGRGDGAAPAHQSIGAPLILLTHYNASAARHIETHALNSRAALERLRAAGARDPRLPALRAVPEFPSDAIVVKTCWWPVAANGTTPLPYWNPRREAGRRGGTPYTAWRSLVAIDPAPGLAASPAGARAARVSFAGRTEANAPRVGLDAFHHVPVDAPLGRRLMADAEARRTASVVLGRPLRPGDHLALVAVHVATRELPEWIWITLWWQGPGPRTDGAAPPFPWRHYALDAAFDAELPRAGDGGARVAFNPWLEARMPDGGAGDGTRSNCLACHRRATYPGTRFLPVTRGAPDLAADPAFEPGKLSTGFLWSIATRAR